MNLISFEEVARNNGENGSKVYVVLHKNVYDLTDYIREVCEKFVFLFISFLKI